MISCANRGGHDIELEWQWPDDFISRSLLGPERTVLAEFGADNSVSDDAGHRSNDIEKQDVLVLYDAFPIALLASP